MKIICLLLKTSFEVEYSMSKFVSLLKCNDLYKRLRKYNISCNVTSLTSVSPFCKENITILTTYMLDLRPGEILFSQTATFVDFVRVRKRIRI